MIDIKQIISKYTIHENDRYSMQVSNHTIYGICNIVYYLYRTKHVNKCLLDDLLRIYKSFFNKLLSPIESKVLFKPSGDLQCYHFSKDSLSIRLYKKTYFEIHCTKKDKYGLYIAKYMDRCDVIGNIMPYNPMEMCRLFLPPIKLEY